MSLLNTCNFTAEPCCILAHEYPYFSKSLLFPVLNAVCHLHSAQPLIYFRSPPAEESQNQSDKLPGKVCSICPVQSSCVFSSWFCIFSLLAKGFIINCKYKFLMDCAEKKKHRLLQISEMMKYEWNTLSRGIWMSPVTVSGTTWSPNISSFGVKLSSVEAVSGSLSGSTLRTRRAFLLLASGPLLIGYKSEYLFREKSVIIDSLHSQGHSKSSQNQTCWGNDSNAKGEKASESWLLWNRED